MKKWITIFCLLTNISLLAQDWGFNLNLGVRKSFELSEKSSLDLRQQFQFTPEIEEYDNQFGDFFNEDGFWSVPDRYDDDDEPGDNDDDDDDMPPGSGSGVPNNGGELTDSPRRITLGWRSTSSFQYNYRFVPWFRSNTGYGLTFDGEALRHTFRAELDYRPMRHGKTRRKLDLAARTLFQYAGQPDDGKMHWSPTVVPRFDCEWAFRKNHVLGMSNTLNGAWEESGFGFDRWRLTTKMVLIYEKIHRFTFSYQYQHRLDKPQSTHGLNFGYEVRF